jgi:hypothetical protein
VTLHFLYRFLQPRNLLLLVALRFRDVTGRWPQALELRLLLRFRPRIRLNKLAELPVLPRQPPLQVCNRRFEPDNLDLRVLLNELFNLLPELDELEFAA